MSLLCAVYWGICAVACVTYFSQHTFTRKATEAHSSGYTKHTSAQMFMFTSAQIKQLTYRVRHSRECIGVLPISLTMT